MSRTVSTEIGNYFNRAFSDYEGVEHDAKRELAHLDFDTIVGTGLSGGLVVPALARALGKHWLIVRKPGVSTHSPSTCEGTLGERWLFVDDFVSTGATLRRVQDAVGDFARRHIHATVYVGTWQYQWRGMYYGGDDL